MGLNQSTHGTWNTNALVNLHLATGAICRPGSGPFSLTGQPNAMGGREMGYMGPGLPGQRSVLVDEDREFTEDLWGVPRGTLRTDVGRGTVEMFEEMAAGAIKACWIICTNPVASVANRGTVIKALETAELVITQDVFAETETNAYADIALPATLWVESDGVMINSERNLTLVQGAADPPGQAVPDWRLIARVACEMGFAEAFTYTCAEEVFEELRQAWNPAPAGTCAASPTNGCAPPPCSGRPPPAAPTTTRSATSTTASARPWSSARTAPAPVWCSRPTPGGPSFTPVRTCPPPNCPTTTTRSSSTPGASSTSGTP